MYAYFQPHIFTVLTANNPASTDTGFVTRKQREYYYYYYYYYTHSVRVKKNPFYIWFYFFLATEPTRWNGTETNTWQSLCRRVWHCTISSGFTFGAKTSRWVHITDEITSSAATSVVCPVLRILDLQEELYLCTFTQINTRRCRTYTCAHTRTHYTHDTRHT